MGEAIPQWALVDVDTDVHAEDEAFIPAAADDEAALLSAARQGSHVAFADLQARLMPEVSRFVRRLVGNTDMDDVVQEVFIALYRHLAQIDPPGKLRPFLFRVARHRCYDALRRRGRYEPASLDEEPLMEWVSLVNADVGRPEELAHWLLMHLEVREAMERLPEAQHEALILYAEEGLSHAEIAEVLGISIGTVKSRVHYARKALRGLLRPETVKALDMEFAGAAP